MQAESFPVKCSTGKVLKILSAADRSQFFSRHLPPPLVPQCEIRGWHHWRNLIISDTRVSFSVTTYSSEQSAKAKTQKELFKTLKELKMHLPLEKRSKGKSNTVNTLKYALRCIKQVKGKASSYWLSFITCTLILSSYSVLVMAN